MLAALGYFDLLWVFWIAAGVAWFASSSAEERSQRVEAKLDRILKHLGLDGDDEPPPS